MNTRTLRKIARKTGIQNIYNSIRRWKDDFFCDHFTCGIGDILLLRDAPSHNQLLLTSRLLDVEEYLSGKNKRFPYQNKISYAAYGTNHREEDGNRSFRKLIESYLKDGYLSDSFITCDKQMNLMDGNHRMGLHIHEKIDTINVRRVHRSIPFQYGGDWYFKMGLPSDFMDKIYQKYYDLQNWLVESGNTFSIYLEGDEKNINDLIRVLDHLCVIMKKTVIADNKSLLQFRMQDPAYKVIHGKLYSERTNTIEQILRSRTSSNITIVVSSNCMEGKSLINKYLK